MSTPGLIDVIIMAADEPHWADKVAAWSTLAAAVLALFAAVGGIAAAVIAGKAYNAQKKIFAAQIEQLQEDRARKEAQDREQEEARERAGLEEARRIRAKAGLFRYGSNTLLRLVQQEEMSSGVDPYRLAVVIVTNESRSPITAVETDLGDTVPKYHWFEGSGKLVLHPRADHLASGATAIFVHPPMNEAEIPHARLGVRFTDDEGRVWRTNAVGKAAMISHRTE